MSKLTLSVVSMTAVLGLSPLFSTAQAKGFEQPSCEGYLVSVAAIDNGPGVAAEIACQPVCGNDCDTEHELQYAQDGWGPFRCSTNDPNIIGLANLIFVTTREMLTSSLEIERRGNILLEARPQYGFGHKGYKCTRLVANSGALDK